MIHDINLPHGSNWPHHAKINGEPTRSVTEVAEMFGYKSTNSLHGAISRGRFPEPDLIVTVQCGKKLYWRLSTLEAEKQRRTK